jgi:arginine-tRNA-protein transferase
MTSSFMTGPDNNLPVQTNRILEELKEYFVESSMTCPYGLPHRAVYHQALFDSVPDFLMGAYLDAGYRRNGNIIYNMHCGNCEACVPLRIVPGEFKPNRNQKRTWRKNRDLTVSMAPLSCSRENLALLEKFLAVRYPEHDSSALDYYNGFFLNHITTTVEISYRIGTRLVGVSVIDLSTSWLNIVFFYFDPDEAGRSPGTYNILYLIDFCMQKGIEFVYLGYWIKDVRQMCYKANFKPHYLRHGNRWTRKDH